MYVCAQGVIEKSVIMGIVTNSNQGSAALSELVTSYAALLAAQVRQFDPRPPPPPHTHTHRHAY